MILNGKEWLNCEVSVDEMRLEHVSEFEYLGCVLNGSGTDETKCRKQVAIGRRVAGNIISLVNTRGLQLEGLAWDIARACFYVYHSDSDMKEEEESRTRAVQMDSLIGLLVIGTAKNEWMHW